MREVKKASEWFSYDLEWDITEKDPKKCKELREIRLNEADDCAIIIIKNLTFINKKLESLYVSS